MSLIPRPLLNYVEKKNCSIGMVETDIPKTGNLELICLEPEYNSVFHTDWSFIAVLSPFQSL